MKVDSTWVSDETAHGPCTIGLSVEQNEIVIQSQASPCQITAAITQVAANKLKIKIDAKCDLGSSHCYPVFSGARHIFIDFKSISEWLISWFQPLNRIVVFSLLVKLT